MQALKQYLIEEFRDRAKGYVACEFKFSHYMKIKPDRASGISLKVDVVKICLRFVDRDMNTLYNGSVVFENNVILKSKEKSFVNISPKELNNKFAFAKAEIIKNIMDEYKDKLTELNKKINELIMYSGNASDVIKPSMKGEVVKISEDDNADMIAKKSFDM